MQKGTVKWFNNEKGFGFISSLGSDYFVHFKEIKAEGRKNLLEGQHVEFVADKTPKGPCAKDVTVVA